MADPDHDGVPAKPLISRRRKMELADGLTEEEREEQANAYARGMWGAKLIMVSLGFAIVSQLLIPLYFIVVGVTKVSVVPILQLAGVLGVINWVLGAIGTGFCVAGLIPQGYYRFAISAAVMVVIHLILLLGVIAKPRVSSNVRQMVDESDIVWYEIPTQYDHLTFYLGKLIFGDTQGLLREGSALGFITGVAEMSRLILILLTLSALAQAAGDLELANRCTRIAGRVSFLPIILTAMVLLATGTLIETGIAILAIKLFGYMMIMGIYTVPAALQLSVLSAAQDVADVCEFPFQSNPVHLGG